EEQRSETVGFEELGDDAVARAEPAAAAAVREHHEPGGLPGHSQVGFDLALAHRNRDRFSNGGAAHGIPFYTPDGYVSGRSAAPLAPPAADHFSSGSSACVSSMCMTASNCLGSRARK